MNIFTEIWKLLGNNLSFSWSLFVLLGLLMFFIYIKNESGYVFYLWLDSIVILFNIFIIKAIFSQAYLLEILKTNWVIIPVFILIFSLYIYFFNKKNDLLTKYQKEQLNLQEKLLDLDIKEKMELYFSKTIINLNMFFIFVTYLITTFLVSFLPFNYSLEKENNVFIFGENTQILLTSITILFAFYLINKISFHLSFVRIQNRTKNTKSNTDKIRLFIEEINEMLKDSTDKLRTMKRVLSKNDLPIYPMSNRLKRIGENLNNEKDIFVKLISLIAIEGNITEMKPLLLNQLKEHFHVKHEEILDALHEEKNKIEKKTRFSPVGETTYDFICSLNPFNKKE